MKIAWHVDDDQEMIEAIRLMMGLLGFEVKAYLNARDAANDLQYSQPDLLLLDILMPDVSGLDLLEFIRRKPELDGLPVLILSTESTDSQVEAALSMGADGFVIKPASLDELEAAINKVLGRRGQG